MFSGGLDCMVVAALAHGCLPEDEPFEPIDLLNVCFDARRRSPDRLAALAGLRELRVSRTRRIQNFKKGIIIEVMIVGH
jgi:asparagine synthetase B (glutamine-hydrolysing)